MKRDSIIIIGLGILGFAILVLWYFTRTEKGKAVIETAKAQAVTEWKAKEQERYVTEFETKKALPPEEPTILGVTVYPESPKKREVRREAYERAKREAQAKGYIPTYIAPQVSAEFEKKVQDIVKKASPTVTQKYPINVYKGKPR